MPEGQRKVYVVDDEPAVLDLSCRLIRAAGYDCHAFGSIAELLQAVDDSVDCIVTDLRMPDFGGVDLLDRLAEMGSGIPVVILTGHADVPTAVRLMQRGVVTVVEKPFEAKELIAAIARALELSEEHREHRVKMRRIQANFRELSEEEREVMREMITGAPNKVIATTLCISPRTLDRRRRTVLDRMGVDSVPELAALAERNRLFG